LRRPEVDTAVPMANGESYDSSIDKSVHTVTLVRLLETEVPIGQTVEVPFLLVVGVTMFEDRPVDPLVLACDDCLVFEVSGTGCTCLFAGRYGFGIPPPVVLLGSSATAIIFFMKSKVAKIKYIKNKSWAKKKGIYKEQKKKESGSIDSTCKLNMQWHH
jgi:hypothetical protein